MRHRRSHQLKKFQITQPFLPFAGRASGKKGEVAQKKLQINGIAKIFLEQRRKLVARWLVVLPATTGDFQ